MKKDPVFYYCEHCGNLVEMVHDSQVPIICCGEPMTELVANTTEGASEKHLPVAERHGDKILVTVGAIHHPMSEEHSIDWIYLQTQHSGQLVKLEKDQKPAANFSLADNDSPIAAYAYCNLHGFWKTLF